MYVFVFQLRHRSGPKQRGGVRFGFVKIFNSSPNVDRERERERTKGGFAFGSFRSSVRHLGIKCILTILNFLPLKTWPGPKIEVGAQQDWWVERSNREV